MRLAQLSKQSYAGDVCDGCAIGYVHSSANGDCIVPQTLELEQPEPFGDHCAGRGRRTRRQQQQFAHDPRRPAPPASRVQRDHAAEQRGARRTTRNSNASWDSFAALEHARVDGDEVDIGIYGNPGSSCSPTPPSATSPAIRERSIA